MTSSGEPLRTLGLILARGGSKRLPGKNLRLLCGKPMVTWSINAALACPHLTSTVVSTDCEAIAQVALTAGARVPFIRPSSLAEDGSTSADAALHALDTLASMGEHYDAVCLVEPTSPMRTRQDLAAAVQRLTDHWKDTDAVVTVGAVHLEKPQLLKKLDAASTLHPWHDTRALEDDNSTAWFPYGVAYVIKTQVLAEKKTFYPTRTAGHPIARWQQYEVDDWIDFLCVEAVMQKHLEQISA